MLAVKTYPQEYIDSCHARMTAQLAAYDALIASAVPTEATEGSGASTALRRFEPLFFNHLVLALDSYFANRTRAIEGKDGNPLNEVRMLGSSILSDQGVLCLDRTIKYRSDTSVLKLAIGDPISLDGDQFRKLSDAFFAEITRRFT